jgi:hypothetical protein
MRPRLPELEALLQDLSAIAEAAEASELFEACKSASLTAKATAEIATELRRLRGKLVTDIALLNADLERELPLVVREASVDDLKRHFSAFVEAAFQAWLEAELLEFEQELAALAERGDALVREAEQAVARPSVIPELGTRALEVDSFPRDFGVFALSTVGIAVLFSNALLGGALLVLAPFVARYGRGRTEVELRSRAAAEAGRAVREAASRLEVELQKRLHTFELELEAFALRSSAEAREGALTLFERSAGGGDWQRRLSELLPRLRAASPETQEERKES